MSAGQAVDAGPAPASGAERGRRRPVRWIAAAVGVVVLGLVGVLATRPDASTRAVDSPLLGQPAPALEARTIDGAPFRLVAAEGEWVLVNFFATWCVPCRQEHDDLIRFHQRHTALGDGRVVGVVYSDSADAVRRFLAENGGDWPMLADPDGRIALDFGVSGVPESFVVSPDGVVAAKIVGGVAAARLEALLGRLQAQAPPAPAGAG